MPILDLEDKATSVELARGLFETLFDVTTAKTEPIIGENVGRVLNTMIEEAAEDTTVADGNTANRNLFHDGVGTLAVTSRDFRIDAFKVGRAEKVGKPVRTRVEFGVGCFLLHLFTRPDAKFLVKSIRSLVPKDHALFNLSKRHADILETLASVDAAVLSTLWPELARRSSIGRSRAKVKDVQIARQSLAREEQCTIRIANNGNSFAHRGRVPTRVENVLRTIFGQIDPFAYFVATGHRNFCTTTAFNHR